MSSEVATVSLASAQRASSPAPAGDVCRAFAAQDTLWHRYQREMERGDSQAALELARRLSPIEDELAELQELISEAEDEGRAKDVIALGRRFLDIRLRSFGEVEARDAMVSLADALETGSMPDFSSFDGRDPAQLARIMQSGAVAGAAAKPEVEALLMRSAQAERCSQTDGQARVEIRGRLVDHLEEAGRSVEAIAVLQEMYTDLKERGGFDHELETVAYSLAGLLNEEGRYQEAEPFAHASGDDEKIADALTGLGRHADAEAYIRRLDDPSRLMANLEAQKRLGDAADVASVAARNAGDGSATVAIASALDVSDAIGAGAPAADAARAGILRARAGDFATATRELESVCDALRVRTVLDSDSRMIGASVATSDGQHRVSVSECYSALAYAALADAPGGKIARDGNTPAKRAFTFLQGVGGADASFALSRAAAREHARNAGASALIDQIEDLDRRIRELNDEAWLDFPPALREWARRMSEQVDVRSFDQAFQDVDMFHDVFSKPEEMAQTINILARAQQRVGGLEAERRRIGAELARVVPDYAEKRVPRQVGLEILMASPGANGSLLRSDEALIVVSPGDPRLPGSSGQGIVYVVTRDTAAWSRIAFDEASLRAEIAALRQMLDPATSARAPDVGRTVTARGFDRQRAFDLYRGIFGGEDVAPLLASKKRWLIAPQGVFLSLPFSALVSAQPADGPAGDADPSALRATTWLGIEKALVTLPSVASLVDLREKPQRASGADVPFFGIGAPAFSGSARPGVVANSLSSVYRDGQLDVTAISALPQLANAEAEIRSLAQLFGVNDQHMLLGARANELEINAAMDRIGRARVIAFATHGLVVGDLAGQILEPALALTPMNPDPKSVSPLGARTRADGLLMASEIADFRLAAEWVILSACNTAAGEGTADGLSGLARAFLYAGAKGLLVSHFAVRDDAAERLTVRVLDLGARSGMDQAEALRLSMQALMNDTSMDRSSATFAHPSAWASFTLVGT